MGMCGELCLSERPRQVRARVFMPECVFELQQEASIGSGQEQSTIAGAPMESSMMLGPFQVRVPCGACGRKASLARAMRARGEDCAAITSVQGPLLSRAVCTQGPTRACH